jgi:hypothetical protein
VYGANRVKVETPWMIYDVIDLYQFDCTAHIVKKLGSWLRAYAQGVDEYSALRLQIFCPECPVAQIIAIFCG